MRLNPSSLKAALATTALLCLSSADSWALTPRSREACGIVQKIDSEKGTLTVLPEKQREPLNVVWKRDTRFIHNLKFADPASLKEGLRACIHYRSPFFGKPFVTKVVWINGA